MYLIEHFSRLQEDGREDTVSVYMPNVDADSLSPELQEASATFMRMAATFTKLAMMHNNHAYLEAGCRMLNRAMADVGRGDLK